ncbi:MAG: VOC family protein [Actinomycetota bacterium]|nr:VOC family protein [Actinomycetota bacterium]
MTIKRLNHAVLYVQDAKASAAFYTEVLGFRVRAALGEQAFFLQADGSDNDHDLALMQVGARPAPPHSIGLYHLAWQVHTLEELAALRTRLTEVGALVGESDHGVSKSLYAKDPDGIEFEVMWAVPRDDWPAEVGTWPLDLAAALNRWPGVDTANQ